jgi:hypothetical protein
MVDLCRLCRRGRPWLRFWRRRCLGPRAASRDRGDVLWVPSIAPWPGCRVANGLPMASSVLEGHRAVGSGFGGLQMRLRDAGYRQTTLDARWGRRVQVPSPTHKVTDASLHVMSRRSTDLDPTAQAAPIDWYVTCVLPGQSPRPSFRDPQAPPVAVKPDPSRPRPDPDARSPDGLATPDHRTISPDRRARA